MAHKLFDELLKSREKGRDRGYLEGGFDMKIRVARRIYETGLTDIGEISSIVGLTEEQLKGILE